MHRLCGVLIIHVCIKGCPKIVHDIELFFCLLITLFFSTITFIARIIYFPEIQLCILRIHANEIKKKHSNFLALILYDNQRTSTFD